MKNPFGGGAAGKQRSDKIPVITTDLARSPSPELAGPTMNPSFVRTQLQQLLDDKSNKLHMVGTMGQKILAQQTELEERIRELGDMDEDSGTEISDTTRTKLLELQDAIKGWDTDNQTLIREIGGDQVSCSAVLFAQASTDFRRLWKSPPTHTLRPTLAPLWRLPTSARGHKAPTRSHGGNAMRSRTEPSTWSLRPRSARTCSSRCADSNPSSQSVTAPSRT